MNIKKLIIFIIIVLLLIISLIVCFMLPLSCISVNSPNNDYIIYQGKNVGKTLKIKSGKNNITIAGPKILQEYSVFNWPLITHKINITSPNDNINNNDITQLAMSTIKSPNNYIDLCKNFPDYWVVCRVGQGGAQSVGVHYENNSWRPYFNKKDIPNIDAQQYFEEIIKISKSEGMTVSSN